MADVIAIHRQQVLHDQVVQRLRAMLVEGRIAAGAKLNERELSERLKVSRTPLREAIKQLAAEGLVQLLPHRGAAAIRLDEHDVQHSFELMAALEGLSGALAAQRIDNDELRAIRALHFEMMAAFTRRDLPAYYRVNAQIHAAINAAAKNPVLTRTYAQTNARLQALRFRSNQDERKWQRAVKEHSLMIDALASRDAPGLRDLLITHLNHKRDVVLEMMRAGTLNLSAKAVHTRNGGTATATARSARRRPPAAVRSAASSGRMTGRDPGSR
jgi:DNA-binding GntR family transcriptional regulator